jgi:NADH-quinone oxidoreductase subunit M
MTVWDLPWLELAIAVALGGSLLVSRFREPLQAFRWGLAGCSAVLVCALLAWWGVIVGDTPAVPRWSVQPALFGKVLFAADQLSAPLIVVVALLHFLTALATSRTKMRRFSLSWSLAAEATKLAALGTREPWVLIGLLAAGTLPGYVELRNRRRSTRVYILHMALFLGLLILGWALIRPAVGPDEQTPWATVPLLAAILIRCGTAPAHCWVTDWFEHASFGNALLFVAPLTGVYAAVRLVLPVAPGWVLHGMGLLSLITAVYAACMAAVQQDARRFFAYLFIGHIALVVVGLQLHTSVSLTGALALWISVALSLAGFGLTLRALEARFGRMSLARFHGLYEHTPTLAVCFLLTGLASVGFPGTLGFVATELLVDGAVDASLYVGLAVIVASAINGIAVVRAYFRLFTGNRHFSTVPLGIGLRERLAVLTLAGLIIGGGLFPQLGLQSRYRAALDLLGQRNHSVPLVNPGR